MRKDCDYQSVKRMLETNPALTYYFKRKVSPCVAQLQRELDINKSINYPKLDIKEFTDNFDAICSAYSLDYSQRDYHQSIMQELNMAIYFGEQNRVMWSQNNCGVNPAVYDIALSFVSLNKLNNTLEKITDELETFRVKWGVRPRDLEDYKELILALRDDSTSVSCVRLDEPLVDELQLPSEFGNY